MLKVKEIFLAFYVKANKLKDTETNWTRESY
jgi:hypothetical protein